MASDHNNSPQKVSDWQTTVLPDGRWLLFHPQTRQMQTLSAPAGILWELCDGETPVSALVDELVEMYPDTDRALLAEQTESMLAMFTKEGLIAHE